MADKTVVVDKVEKTKETASPAVSGAALGNSSLKECRDAHSAMQPKCDLGLSNLTLTAGQTSERTNKLGATSDAGGTGSISSVPVEHQKTGMVNAPETLERSATAIKNTEDFLTAKDTSGADKLRAAGVLAANGVHEVSGADGKQYSFGIDKNLNVNLSTTDAQGHKTQESGKISESGALENSKPKGSTRGLDTGTSTNINVDNALDHTPVPLKNPDGTDRAPDPSGIDAAKKPTSKETLFDPHASQEDKLKAARDMADHGEKRFKGPDGKEYEIGTQKFGTREGVTIFQNDGKGHSHLMMRGIVDGNGNVEHQKDKHGKSVDIQSDWAKKHGGENSMLRHDEPKPEKQEKPKIDNDDKTHEGDKKLEGTPEEQKALDAARERLKKDVQANISKPEDRDKFNKDMEDFEKRATTQPLKAKEVADSYDQMSKLLEAKDGAVDKGNRVLAAETAMHHMAAPQDIDQGQHNTCNMTTLEEHLMTRNPSKAAEIVTSMATKGSWTAPDGKEVKVDKNSLTPGAEEAGKNPPTDGDRSYATQLMNLALVNDVTQRKIPPQIYSQEKPSGFGDSGERLRFADGSDVTENDVCGDGNKKPWNAPNVHARDIAAEGKAISGDSNFVIENGKGGAEAGTVGVNSADDLKRTLAEMKANGKFPGIIMVDANTQAFGGNPAQGPGWHVVSVTGYDEKTGKVHISNQWGKSGDRDMSVDDLYRSTYTN